MKQINTRHFHKKEVHSGKVVGAKEQEHGSSKVLWVIKFSPDEGKCLMACLDLKHGMVLFCLKEFTLGANFGIHLGGHRFLYLTKGEYSKHRVASDHLLTRQLSTNETIISLI